MSVCLSIYFWISLSVCSSVYKFFECVCLPTCLSVCLSVYLSIFQPASLSVCQSVCVFGYLCIWTCRCLSANWCLTCLFICFAVWVFVCLSACLSVLQSSCRSLSFVCSLSMSLFFLSVFMFPTPYLAAPCIGLESGAWQRALSGKPLRWRFSAVDLLVQTSLDQLILKL